MVHGISYLAEWYCNILKPPHKGNLGKYRSCNLQFSHNPNENPSVQHICKEQNSACAKWGLFEHNSKLQLWFAYSRPLSIIALFCRPTVLPKALFFSISFLFWWVSGELSQVCNASLQMWHFLVSRAGGHLLKQNYCVCFHSFLWCCQGGIVAFSNGLDNHLWGAKLLAFL